MINNELTMEDRQLFRRMTVECRTENERLFFERMRHKQEHEITATIDIILHERDNSDKLFIVRYWFDEYAIGREDLPREYHFMSLSEALAANVKQLALLDEDITLFEWLRRRDYAGVKYDQNQDML